MASPDKQARQSGASEAELLRSYPQTGWGSGQRAWAYVRSHRDQIDAQIRENEAA